MKREWEFYFILFVTVTVVVVVVVSDVVVVVVFDRWIVAHCNICSYYGSTLDVYGFVCFFAFIRNEHFLIIYTF